MHAARPSHPTPYLFISVGCIALALAMGIGRFGFTPLLPLMMRDATLDAAGGAMWAAANYLGYLVGALSTSWLGGRTRGGLIAGQIGVALSTLALAWLGDWYWIGLVLRFTAGVFSAWVMVCVAAWCFAELASVNALHLSGWIYTGVGLGIAVTGLVTWLGGQQSASLLWFELGVMALVGSAFTISKIRARPPTLPLSTPEAPRSNQAPTKRHVGIVICYICLGFGYIVPATYLPAMARQLVSDPLVFGLTWPVFGAAAAASVAITTRWLSYWPRRRIWAISQATMAVGTLLPILQQSIPSLLVSAILVGGTFMVGTMAGLQLVREVLPVNPTPLLSRVTTGFAAGQICGPLLVRALGLHQILGWSAMDWSCALATVMLVGSAVWLWLSNNPSSGFRSLKTTSGNEFY